MFHMIPKHIYESGRLFFLYIVAFQLNSKISTHVFLIFDDFMKSFLLGDKLPILQRNGDDDDDDDDYVYDGCCCC